MIDFRYHLVSIISIFVALAVGILLGAGPLQGGLGSQLSDQVSALRTEKAQLNERLTMVQKQVTADEAYADAVEPRVIDGRLTGHRITLIALPDADSRLINRLTDAVEASGATLTSTLRMSSDWFDPAETAARGEAAAAAAVALGMTSTATGDTLLDQVLVRIAVDKELIEATSSHDAAVTVLEDAGLFSATEPVFAPGDIGIVVSGSFAGTEDVVQTRADAIRSLMRQVAVGSAASVVAGPPPVIAAGQPVTSDAVSAVREDPDTAKVIPTVDHARDGSGPATVVLALESALDGRIGHYGTATGATAVVPKVKP